MISVELLRQWSGLCRLILEEMTMRTGTINKMLPNSVRIYQSPCSYNNINAYIYRVRPAEVPNNSCQSLGREWNHNVAVVSPGHQKPQNTLKKSGRRPPITCRVSPAFSDECFPPNGPLFMRIVYFGPTKAVSNALPWMRDRR